MRWALLFALIVLPAVSYAHPGRTDANGCHTNRKTGEHHCHGDSVKSVNVSARTTARVADKNCPDFSSQKAAQDFFVANGGPKKDSHRLDQDKDGVACEELK